MFFADLGRPSWECLHFGSSGVAAEFRSKGDAAGLFIAEADIDTLETEKQLIVAIGEVLPFSTTFFPTWDGLADGLDGLRPRIDRKGVGLVLAGAKPFFTRNPEALGLLIEIWQHAARRWGSDLRDDQDLPGRPFHLFVRW